MQNESSPQTLSIILNFVLSVITLGVSSYIKSRKRKNKGNRRGRKSDNRKRNNNDANSNNDKSRVTPE